MEYTILSSKPDSFDVEEMVKTSDAIIFFNHSKKEQMFLPKALKQSFEEKLSESIVANKSLLEHKFTIFFQTGKTANGKTYTLIKGINVHGKVESVKGFDF